MYCKKCGSFIEDDMNFCPGCGAKKSKGGNIAAIIGIIVGIIVLIGGLGFAGLVLFSTDEEPEQADNSTTNRRNDDDDYDDDDDDDKDKGSVTIMAYFLGSNLETDGGYASDDIEEMMAAEYGKDINIILQTGGAKDWALEEIADGVVERFQIKDGELIELENLGKLSMVEKETLTDFIEFCADEYPADNYVLVMWDHGGWIPISFGIDEIFIGELTDVEIGEAIADSGVHFHSLIFDACNMCSLEVALAIKDNVDYMVAAESYVNGIGMYYTNWITDIGDNKGIDSVDYCETIVSDYMDSLEDRRMIGSMSVINLDKVIDVYDAYINYIWDVNQYVESGGYADYMIARGDCGYYEDTDSVDICTLCSKFPNDYSTALFNSVVNAVVYTESDLSYGHGLTVYSPYEFAEYYDDGRTSLEALGYDETITGFYDALVSRMYDYSGLTTSGSWYVDNSGSYQGEYTMDDEIEVADLGDYFGVLLSDNDWDIIDNIAITLLYDLGDGTVIYLGRDYWYETDDDGNLVLIDPDAWVFIGDEPASYECMDYYYDSSTGDWYQFGYIYAYVNDMPSFIEVYFDQDNDGGVITGYYDADFDTFEIGDAINLFKDSDMIQPVYCYFNLNDDSDEGFAYFVDAVYYSELDFSFSGLNLANYDTYLYYTFEDVYGNYYETEMVGYYAN